MLTIQQDWSHNHFETIILKSEETILLNSNLFLSLGLLDLGQGDSQ